MNTHHSQGMDYLFGGLKIESLLWEPIKVCCSLMVLQLGGIPVPRRGNAAATALWAGTSRVHHLTQNRCRSIYTHSSPHSLADNTPSLAVIIVWMIILVAQVVMVLVSLAMEIVACAAFITYLSPCARTGRIGAKFWRMIGFSSSSKRTMFTEVLALTFFFQPCFLSKMISMWIFGDAIMQGLKVAAAAELLRIEEHITSRLFKADARMTLRRGDELTMKFSSALRYDTDAAAADGHDIEEKENDQKFVYSLTPGISKRNFLQVRCIVNNKAG